MSKEIWYVTPEELFQMFGGEAFEAFKRRADGAYRAFTKIMLKPSTDQEMLKTIENAVKNLQEQSTELNKELSQITKAINCSTSTLMSSIGAVTGVLNLCATVAGFIIIAKKIDSVNENLSTLLKTVLDAHELETFYKLKIVKGNYTQMLDDKKIGKALKEEELRRLIDDEAAVLDLLRGCIVKDLCGSKSDILYAIVSLSSMMANTIMEYDEMYYFAHRDHQKWYSGHDSWMSVFDKLSSTEFRTKLQDYIFLERGFNQYETDLAVVTYIDNFLEAKQAIQDKQQIIEITDSLEKSKQILELAKQYAVNKTTEVYSKLDIGDNEKIAQMVNVTASQIGVLVN